MCLAVPGKILSITGEDALTRTAKVSFGGVIKEVSLACVPEAKVGDYVIVHVGFALSIVDEHEAQRVFETFDLMERLDDLRGPDADLRPDAQAGPTNPPATQTVAEPG